MPQSQRLSSVIPFAAIERPACPKCKAQMTLVSIEPARARGVDLQTFECAVCNQILTNFAAFEDPMKSRRLGRWLQGDLHSPKVRPAGVNRRIGRREIWELMTDRDFINGSTIEHQPVAR